MVVVKTSHHVSPYLNKANEEIVLAINLNEHHHRSQVQCNHPRLPFRKDRKILDKEHDYHYPSILPKVNPLAL